MAIQYTIYLFHIFILGKENVGFEGPKGDKGWKGDRGPPGQPYVPKPGNDNTTVGPKGEKGLQGIPVMRNIYTYTYIYYQISIFYFYPVINRYQKLWIK